MRAIAALGTLSFCLLSCGGAPPASTTAPDPQAEPAPQKEPVAQPEPVAQQEPASPVEAASQPEPASEPDPEHLDEMFELVRGNIASTDLSALVEIRGARIEGPNGGPAPTAGYVNLIYEVEVVTPLCGCGKTKSFEFAEMADAGFKPMKVGTILFASVCRDEDGRYHTPDVGYAIPQSELPANAAKRFAAKPPKKVANACGE